MQAVSAVPNALGEAKSLLKDYSTGNAMLDMAIMASVPMVLGFLMNALESSLPLLWRGMLFVGSWVGYGRAYQRTITHESTSNRWGYSFTMEDERNNILQKALTLYIGSEHVPSMNVKNVKLLKTKIGPNRYWYDDDDDDTPGKKKRRQYQVTGMPPERKWLDVAPQIQMQHYVQEDKGEGDSVKSVKKVFVLRCSARNAETKINDFVKKVFEWYTNKIEEETDNVRYMYSLIAKPPPSLFSDDKDDKPDEARKYKRYKLSDEKTFESLFFPEKDLLLRTLGDFEEKRGKYSVPGYPHKLGLLLHGPPGTGKTSLIKALAHKTGRSIVSLPLSRIRTNQDLMDMVFDQTFAVAGEELPVKLNFSQCIYVMEDVDAASAIVHARDPATTTTTVEVTTAPDSPDGVPQTLSLTKQTSVSAQGKQANKVTLRRETSALGALPETSTVIETTTSAEGKGKTTLRRTTSTMDADGDTKTTTEVVTETDAEGGESKTTKIVRQSSMTAEGEEKVVSEEKTEAEGAGADGDGKQEAKPKKKKRKPAGHDSSPALESAGSSDSINSVDQDILDNLAVGGMGADDDTSGLLSSFMSSKKKTDKLDLAGLLNVLDGVVDCPGRIVVMTTNHPEKLDPALIRPGRVNKKIYMGFMVAESALQMLQHYCDEVTDAQAQEIKDIFNLYPDMRVTPAQLEQMTAEFDDTQQLIYALRDRALGIVAEE